MADVRPFRAWRPTVENAPTVASPPYDVLNTEEARAMARENPLSFLHVVKPEIDLPPGTDHYSEEVYRTGSENLNRLRSEGVLVQDPEPCFYAYQQRMGEHVQVGLVAGASVAEYDRDEIKKHEHTRPEKEDDRTRHLDALNANTGPVFLTYRSRPAIDAAVDEIRAGTPEYDFTAPDGVGHTLWAVRDAGMIDLLRTQFAGVDYLYVADGHHRSASASRVAGTRKAGNPGHTGEEEYNYFLTVIFPHDQMKILDYNRVVVDLNGRDETEFLREVGEVFAVRETDSPKPEKRRTFGMYLGRRWFALAADADASSPGSAAQALDCAILQNRLLSPILGIDDPRTDSRIDFVGGIRGLEELEKRVAAGAAVAFAMYPTSIEELMAIADQGEVMPPKSTWFEPKLRSGLIIRPLD